MDKASIFLNDDTALVVVIAATVIAALALWLLGSGVRRIFHRRVISGSARGVTGVALLALLALLASIAFNLYTYHRFTHEQAVARLSFLQTGEQTFSATILFPDNRQQAFELRGDEWQLDARVLKWEGMATLIGLDSLYRLDRLSGRYQNLQQEQNGQRSVYDLADNPGLDLWKIAQRHRSWLPWVDASYGSATYLPMADGAVYAVHLSATGLLARPENVAATDAVKDWR